MTGGREHVTDRLELQTLGSQPVVMPKNLPITDLDWMTD